METTISQRVTEIIKKYYGQTPSRLAKAMGWKRAENIYNVIDEGKDKWGVDIAQKILEIHPEISAEWFLRDEGPVLKGAKEYPADYEKIKKELEETKNKYISLLEKISVLKESL